jgi:putative FmdB family regulatory protein
MPTYEYECDACGHIFEKFQSITAKPVRKCPECNGHVRRLIGAGSGVIFKGSGFYETDYKRKRTGAAASNGGKSESAGSASAKSDTGSSGEQAGASKSESSSKG